MKAGIILGLLTSPLMASTNGYDQITILNDFNKAVEKGIKWQYVQDFGDIPDEYYMQFPISFYNQKYAYYQYALGEEFYYWTSDNQVPETTGTLKPSDFNQSSLDWWTVGFAFNLSDMETTTQSLIDSNTQYDIIININMGSVEGSAYQKLSIAYCLYDIGNKNQLMSGTIIDNSVSTTIDGFPLDNVGINYIIGNPSYVIDNTATITNDYITLGVSIDLTSWLISQNLFNDFNNNMIENRSGYIVLFLSIRPYITYYPNDEYNSFTTVSARIGTGYNLENTRYVDGYNTGYNNGYETGYQQGYDSAPKTNTESTVQSLLGALFGSLKDLLDVELLPGISVGTILGIPIVLTIITWVIHWIRG